MHYSSFFNTKLYGSILTGTSVEGRVSNAGGVWEQPLFRPTVLAGLPKVTTAPLQRAQDAAARLILRLAPHDHVTAALRHLHWLPVQYRITYKFRLLMHRIHIH